MNSAEIKTSIQNRLSLADLDEMQKCRQSPVYFYNKYVRKEWEKELIEQEYSDFAKKAESLRNRTPRYWDHAVYPMAHNDEINFNK